MQTVYLVSGSEDGPLGVFGSVRSAHHCSSRYLGRNLEASELLDLSAMRKGQTNIVMVYDGGMSVTITAMALNYDLNA
tara:strand:- start:2586 stop:2819 length:234 start_codon:yes stop_codon:yes gene_type:complete